MTRKRFQKLCRALFVEYYKRNGLKLSEKETNFSKFGIDHHVCGANYANLYAAIKNALC